MVDDKKDTLASWRTTFVLSRWHGGVFKYPTRPSQVDTIDDRPKSAMCGIINRYIATNVNDKYGIKVNYQYLYMLGFYEYVVSKHGEKRAQELATSFRNSKDANELMQCAKEYGVGAIANNISHLKRLLRPFVSTKGEE